jgi:predicted AAA+ superfamily ATPase
MSSGYNIPLVTALCDLSPDALSMSRSEQVEHLSSIGQADITTARAFYARNHVTSGMSEFLRGALRRLSGQSQQAVFELRQAMGGGKTHNMIALGLLARFPDLKEELPAAITEGMGTQPAKIATVNGRDVHNFIWGDIAEQLGRSEEFRDHWVSGPKSMSEGDWMRLIGDEPTLIMLDELPPYLAVAHTQPVGQGTLLDLLKYSLANLFSAAMKSPRCVVVVASLDAAYDEARRTLGGILADLKNEISRGAQSITPVDLSTDEIYDILRKRLFTKLPDPDGSEVDRVAQAYLATYREGAQGCLRWLSVTS